MNEMSEMKDKIRQALPKGVEVDDAVLEKIVGGIQTGMTQTQLNDLLKSMGIDRKIVLPAGISKPRPS